MQETISYPTRNPYIKQQSLDVSSNTSQRLSRGGRSALATEVTAISDAVASESSQRSRPITQPSTTSTMTPFMAARSGATDTVDAVIRRTASENVVAVIGRRGCCMCLVVRRLLQGLGVDPPVFEAEEGEEEEIIRALTRINQGANYGLGGISDVNDDVRGMIELPAVMMGGKLFGGVEKVMAAHISGELLPLLKKAGALWL